MDNITPIFISWLKEHINDYQFNTPEAVAFREKLISFDEGSQPLTSIADIYGEFLRLFSNNVLTSSYSDNLMPITTDKIDCYVVKSDYNVLTPLGLLGPGYRTRYIYAAARIEFEKKFSKEEEKVFSIKKKDEAIRRAEKVSVLSRPSIGRSVLEFIAVIVIMLGIIFNIELIKGDINNGITGIIIWSVVGVLSLIVLITFLVDIKRLLKRIRFNNALNWYKSVMNNYQYKYPEDYERKVGSIADSGEGVVQNGYTRNALVCEDVDVQIVNISNSFSSNHELIPKHSSTYSEEKKHIERCTDDLENMMSSNGKSAFGVICFIFAALIITFLFYVVKKDEYYSVINKYFTGIEKDPVVEQENVASPTPEATPSPTPMPKITKYEDANILSVYAEIGGEEIDSEKLWDNNKKTVWVTDNWKKTLITYNLAEITNISYVSICNGHSVTNGKYNSNGRPSSLKFRFYLNGELIGTEIVFFADMYSEDMIRRGFSHTYECDRIEVKILDIHTGKKDNTCISEISFGESYLE